MVGSARPHLDLWEKEKPSVVVLGELEGMEARDCFGHTTERRFASCL
jgi:hypothetical protein